MKIHGSLLTTLLIALVCSSLFGQRTTWTYIPNDRHVADSLLHLLQKEQDPRKQTLLYKGLSWNYRDTNMDTAIMYADKGLEIAAKINFDTATVDITRFKSIIYWNFLHHNVAYDLNNTALELAKQIGYKVGEGFGYDRIGIMEYYKGNYEKAIKSFLLAKKIFTEIQEKDGIAYAYSHLNWAYTELKKFDLALDAGYRSLELRNEQKNIRGIAKSQNDLAITYKEIGDIQTAINYYKKSIENARKINDLIFVAEFSQQLSEVYISQNKLDSALQLADISYEIARKINHRRQIVKTAMVLSQVYQKKGDFQQAYHYLDNYHSTKDSLVLEEAHRNILQQEIEYEYEKEQQAIMQKQMFIRIGLIAAIVLITIIAVLILFNIRRAKRDNRLLHQKNIEIVKQKEEIEKQAARLSDLNKMNNKLFSIVSHDLKNPLALTSTYLHLLDIDGVDVKEFKQLLPDISKHLTNTMSLLNNLLIWAKSQMEGMKTTPVEFEINHLAQKNVDFIQSFARHKSITIENEIPINLVGYADPSFLDIVFRNLLTNAVKFCKAGDNIVLTAEACQSFIQVNIEDTGRGIESQKIATLFSGQITSQLGTNREPGWGLGLMLCKEFVETNGGKISVESEPGKGSIFHFTIPMA